MASQVLRSQMTWVSSYELGLVSFFTSPCQLWKYLVSFFSIIKTSEKTKGKSLIIQWELQKIKLPIYIWALQWFLQISYFLTITLFLQIFRKKNTFWQDHKYINLSTLPTPEHDITWHGPILITIAFCEGTDASFPVEKDQQQDWIKNTL